MPDKVIYVSNDIYNQAEQRMTSFLLNNLADEIPQMPLAAFKKIVAEAGGIAIVSGVNSIKEDREELKRQNIVKLEEQEDGTYLAFIPFFPGCIATGRDKKHALNILLRTVDGWLRSEMLREHDVDVDISDVEGYNKLGELADALSGDAIEDMLGSILRSQGLSLPKRLAPSVFLSLSRSIQQVLVEHNVAPTMNDVNNLLKVLEPFVKETDRIDPLNDLGAVINDTTEIWQIGGVDITRSKITYGDLRKARDVVHEILERE